MASVKAETSSKYDGKLDSIRIAFADNGGITVSKSFRPKPRKAANSMGGLDYLPDETASFTTKREAVDYIETCLGERDADDR